MPAEVEDDAFAMAPCLARPSRRQPVPPVVGPIPDTVELVLADRVYIAKAGPDFLDADARIVIELDGPQHLANRNAYRRDRLKDALLQENGYFVLRFLAEDLGTRLDAVFDQIDRALSHRAKSRP